jgi:hypothetical protein
VTLKPKLVIQVMSAWQALVLKVIGWMIGIRGEAKIVYLQFDNDDEVEPTINDIVKNNAEDEANSVSTQTN